MADEPERDLIAEMSRDVVAEVAPDELSLFRMNSSAYFKNPKKALESQEAKDDALGFGIEAAVPLLTPIVIAVVSEVITHLEQSLSTHLASGAEGAVSGGLRSVFKRGGKGTAAPAQLSPAQLSPAQLSPAQLAEVRDIAFKKARQLKLPETQAAMLADSVVGGLVVAPTG
jgi:hypothetical protein